MQIRVQFQCCTEGLIQFVGIAHKALFSRAAIPISAATSLQYFASEARPRVKPPSFIWRFGRVLLFFYESGKFDRAVI